MAKRTKAEAADAMETLRRVVKEGDTLHCVLRSVSRGGMGRRLDVYHLAPSPDLRSGYGNALVKSYLTGCAATVLGYRHSLQDWRRGSGLYVGGCGFDAGHEVVSNLSHKLFGRADALRMEWL